RGEDRVVREDEEAPAGVDEGLDELRGPGDGLLLVDEHAVHVRQPALDGLDLAHGPYRALPAPRGRSVAAVDPLLQVRLLGAHRRRVAVAGEHLGGPRQGEEPLTDRVDDRREVGVGAAGRAGATVEEGVTGEQDAAL